MCPTNIGKEGIFFFKFEGLFTGEKSLDVLTSNLKWSVKSRARDVN